MKLVRLVICAAALSVATMAVANDPFYDATVAVRFKQNEKAAELINSGQFNVNQQNEEGYTLLHFAADQNNLEMARALLARGADPNIKTNSGSSVADMAYSGSTLLAEVLKAGGKYARNKPHNPSPAPPPRQSKAPALKPAATPQPGDDPRRKMCNGRHYSSSSLCSDSTCKMREYRKWQTCLKTGSYN